MLRFGAPNGGWPAFGPNGKKAEVDCRGHATEVQWTIDPFAHEIADVKVWGWFCEACLHESAMDI